MHRRAAIDPADSEQRVLRLALVSASPLIRAGLAAGIGEQTRLAVVSSVPSVFDITPSDLMTVDVLLMETDQPDAAAQARLSDLIEAAGCACVLLLPEEDEAPINEQWLHWLSRGFTVLPRTADWPQIEAAAFAAAAGLVSGTQKAAVSVLRWLSPQWVSRSGQPGLQHSTGRPVLLADTQMDPLTPREREVLGQMIEGLANREIAQRLQISTHTAKFHVAQIIAKLHASSRAHAVAKAVRAGLVSTTG